MKREDPTDRSPETGDRPPTGAARRTRRLEKELRVLKAYAAGSAVAILVLLTAAFSPGERDAAEVVEAERINIRHPDGTLALAIAGKGRLPGPTFGGREYPQELSGGRTRAAGMIFFNERGDEVGGLTYHGHARSGSGYRASGMLAFDQFRQDQVVAIQYGDDGESRHAGFRVWDRTDEIPIGRMLEVIAARADARGAERDSLDRIVQGWREQGVGARRVYLGSANRTATLLLRDTEGRTRIRLSVDSTDVARLEFLDENGDVVRSLPE